MVWLWGELHGPPERFRHTERVDDFLGPVVVDVAGR
jgi:hypothetical protein